MTENNNIKYEFLSEDPNAKTLPIMVALIIGAFFAILNETLLNIALTTLMAEFDITLSTVQWVATGFMLVMAIVIPVSPLLMGWFTTRQLFIGTMVTFLIGTVVAAFAPTFSVLLLGRMIQAIGTGLIMPIMFNVFLLIYPPHKRGKIMGIVGLVIMFAPAIGPTLSGVIVEYFGWRFLFIFVMPFTVFSILFALKYLVNITEITKPKIDWISLVYSTIGLGATIYGFSHAGESADGFMTPSVFIPIIIGLIGILLFVLRQFKLDEPLMDLRVFKFPMFAHAVVLFVIIIMMMFASELILPVFMQGPMGLTAAAAGLLLLPGSLLNGAMSPFMGALFDKVGPKVMMIPATIVLAVTMFMFSNLTADTPQWVIIAGFMLIMLSVSATMMPAETNGLNQLPKHLYPHGTAVVSTLQPLAGAIGVSVFIGLLNSRQQSYLEGAANPESEAAMTAAMVSGVEFVYFLIFIIALIAVVMSLFVYRAKPIEDLVPAPVKKDNN
ncbi:MDR family MFS transporter [Jeotgalicoccus halotolerans]|jgi:drug resistance transporter, EmrB/QacA subfamily|uniref:Multidrug efflux MFS transporter n=1 Tax=Jeotgalicoccus nanhaiensis TaxID=568603 RepID=A0ABR9XZV2_9STAP|nr:MDR family MFS transporter [Jeotgalicoccus nanhaiensis]MBF0754266.1 multidrug efflux MFS transporter [Jeotgalicoccus nanhaiensis]TFU61444.1 DHA2 family efflux MFS transporter permease subunit [Jeotgalicoccus nanhaiensis]